MQKTILTCISVTILICCCFTLQAQSNKTVGFEYSIGLSTGGYSVEKYGLTFEKHISNHWGFETGLFAKKMNLFDSNIRLSYVQIPFSWKYYSKIVNIGLGLGTNVYTGANSMDKNFYVDHISGFPIINFETILKFGHDFYFYKDKWLIEPSVSIIPLTTNDGSLNGGVGAKLKYNFD